jgi:hypothetical protein
MGVGAGIEAGTGVDVGKTASTVAQSGICSFQIKSVGKTCWVASMERRVASS